MSKPQITKVSAAGVNRRSFLRQTAALTVLTAASGLGRPGSSPAAVPGEVRLTEGLVDCNVSLGRWPSRRLPLDEPGALVRALRRAGVAKAWTGSFEGILHNDLAGANERLAEACARHGRNNCLIPFGTINPRLAGWERDLERCVHHYKMPGIRLYPSYHGYTLDDPVFGGVLRAADQMELIIQLPVLLEDERTQHPLLTVKHLDARPLPKLLKDCGRVRVLLMNWWRGVPRALLPALTGSGRVFLDMAAVEGVNGVRSLLDQVPLSSVVFGSYSPFFYLESSLLKLKESELTKVELAALCTGNARKLLDR